MTNVVAIEDHMTKAWEAYVSAQRLAESTGEMKDGIAAGHAWRRWLSLFTPETHKQVVADRATA